MNDGMSEADLAVASHEFEMSLKTHLSEAEVVEELRLLADSMSSQKALAEKIGIPASRLSEILHRRVRPTPPVLAFLKLERVVMYREKKP